MKSKKICFICSSGGHFSELNHLQKISDMYDSFLVTEGTKKLDSNFCSKKYLLKEINRKEKIFILHFLGLFLKELNIFLKEKPDFVITTGALCSYPMIKIAKFFKKKVIYIESFARVNDLSLTGKKLYGKVDLFLVQWPELLNDYPKAKYYGNIFNEEY